MKPEFSKPFDIISAKAGAPYCCRAGRTAQILKWDRNVSDYPLMGVIGKSDDPRTWAITGSITYDAQGEEYDCDLVMLPLGFIDGKPVFVGDEYLGIADTPAKAEPKHAGMSFSGCKWPVPMPEYPKTKMVFNELADVYEGTRSTMDGYSAVANAAIRHGIDNGYLLDPRELQQTISIKASPEDVQRIMSGDTGRASIQYIPTNEPAWDVKRDLAIALAVRNYCVARCEPIFGNAQVMRVLGDMDLAAIIAGVADAKDTQRFDFSITKGDIVYKKTWCEGREPLEVVNVNWALKAIAVKLSATGATVVWPIEGMRKEHFPMDTKESER